MWPGLNVQGEHPGDRLSVVGVGWASVSSCWVSGECRASGKGQKGLGDVSSCPVERAAAVTPREA